MRAIPTAIPDVLLVESSVFSDERGFFTEVYHAEKFATLGLPTAFAQDNHSRSIRGTIRGLHYQTQRPQGKLVRVTSGRIYDVAVDLRRSSPTFSQYVGVDLEAGDGRQLWIPPGFGHGFLVLSDGADVSYKCTTTYDAISDRSLLWNDEQLRIEWPLDLTVAPRLSHKDVAAPPLAVAELFA